MEGFECPTKLEAGARVSIDGCNCKIKLRPKSLLQKVRKRQLNSLLRFYKSPPREGFFLCPITFITMSSSVKNYHSNLWANNKSN